MWSFNQSAGVVLTALLAAQSVSVAAQDQPYSPYLGHATKTQLLWGDTHLHTDLSLDARAFGVTLSPEEAFRFARGEVVTSSHGEKVKLDRPLDFLVVSDHSDGMGAMKSIIAGEPSLLTDPQVKDWSERINQGGDTALNATMDVIVKFTNGEIPEVLKSEAFSRTVWEEYLDTVERFNDPGVFTSLIGYEWTSTEGGNNLHRNVIYRGDREDAKALLPFTTDESFNPEDLWRWMAAYEGKTSSEVLAIAHNGNLSNGLMFPVETNPATGKPLDGDYAATRARWEPLYEITQIKGDGESHPYLSATDEFAGHDVLWDRTNLGPVAKEKSMLQYEYAREALKNGLAMKAKLGTNPYKFGVIGSTDSHTALSTAAEDNFFGKHSGVEPGADRWKHRVGSFGEFVTLGWQMLASGYMGVWAEDNTRTAIFDAMKRKETYATTGPRITVRFFGGWDFTDTDLDAPTLAEVGYAKGVSMGGDLPAAKTGDAPTFLIAAMKDADRANLDRIQVIKGWVDAEGKTHERVFDVVWSDMDQRTVGADGKVPAVGNTVDVPSATWRNSIGASELRTVWRDPVFDPSLRAFYYAKVIEIPTPRWTAYDDVRYQTKAGDDVPMTVQDRAYTSPIWYTPN